MDSLDLYALVREKERNSQLAVRVRDNRIEVCNMVRNDSKDCHWHYYDTVSNFLDCFFDYA